MSINKCFSVFLLSATVFAKLTFAVPFNVTGEWEIFENLKSIYVPLSGTMEILAPEVDETSMGKTFFYKIPSYKLYVNGELKEGSGFINAYYYDYVGAGNEFTCPFDEFVVYGDLNWRIESYSTNFYFADGTVYEKRGSPDDFYSLPAKIVSPIVYPFKNLVIIRQISNVPELNPSNLFILGLVVFTALLSIRRKIKKTN